MNLKPIRNGDPTLFDRSTACSLPIMRIWFSTWFQTISFDTKLFSEPEGFRTLFMKEREFLASSKIYKKFRIYDT